MPSPSGNLAKGLIKPSSLFMGSNPPITGGTTTVSSLVPYKPTISPNAAPIQTNFNTPSTLALGNANSTSSFAAQPPATPTYESFASQYPNGITYKPNIAQNPPQPTPLPTQPTPPPAQPAPQPTPQPQQPTPPPETNPYKATAPTYSGLVGGLAGMAAQSTPEFQAAQKRFLEASNELQKLRTEQAKQSANIEGSRTNLAEAGGEQGLLQRLAAGKEAALTGEMTAAQAAAQVATGQQQTQQTGLTAAGGLAAPVPAQPYGFVSPTTMELSPYGGGGGTAGEGIGRGAEVTGNMALAQNYFASQRPAYNQAQTVVQDLTDLFQNTPELNPSTFNPLNFYNQWLSGNFSSAAYQRLGRDLTELLTTLTPIVGAQGVSNYKSQLVQSMINPTASATSIQRQIQDMMNLAKGKLDATRETFTGGGSATQSTSGGTNIQIPSVGNFTQKPDGSWEYKP